MNRKQRYIPMEKRIANLADLVVLNDIDSENPIDIARYNALEEALAIMENRETVLKEVAVHKRNAIKRLIEKLNVRWFRTA